ncbi:hypothetical protein B0H13DRAFT_2372319 [Mycena leptocephala]|nr:hypothetical protein B0H13DRAFT_2372319 [Mycena leptocephala]
MTSTSSVHLRTQPYFYTTFSAAIAICAIVIFFAMRWPRLEIYWRGNTRFLEGCDAEGCARMRIPGQGFFGPGPGEFY